MHLPQPALSRRSFLKGATAGGLAIRIGLPALDAMFNISGTAYAATDAPREIEKRFLLWFNGNGISEKYWIPSETGADYPITPCLSPLATLRDDVHIITGLDSPAARLPGPGNSHYPSMSALLTGQVYTGRGAGGASFDQILAQQIGGESRFRSLQIGVSQECFGEAIQRNMSWADRDRPLPPETLPNRLFDRLFGEKEGGWVERQKSVLDAVSEDAERLNKRLGSTDRQRLEGYLSSVRDLERSITSLPPEYREVVERPTEGGDLRDWPRIAKLQSDLLVHAFASRQTRVASYMLTKCQGLARFPWLGHTAERHHEYTHGQVETPRGARILRDINRWHVEEFAYLVAKLKSTPEGEGTLLDNTCAVFVHEHAEANAHKNNGLAAIVAGHVGGLKTGTHTRLTGSIGDLYVTVAQEALGAGKLEFPTAEKKLSEIV
ncbi:MAG: DUF1552 domain-containing protein [Acidobacteria bacterium]|nr:DUF1552 domain-containing protein [Acidobacteriota bacterium]MDA1235673.1 DUF1552 domain-containing protein [Acidobacteriota bacterium]